jgi:hypothetical protein
MSDNPFRDLPDPNPYAPPSLEAGANSSNPLLMPAMFLLIFSLLFVVILVVSLPMQALHLSTIDTSTDNGMVIWVGTIALLALLILANTAIAWGAFSMIQLKSYRSAYTAAVLSVIPFCSPCYVFGIPFGIWAIVLMNRPEIKQRFLK